jgi:hypothetical protein
LREGSWALPVPLTRAYLRWFDHEHAMVLTRCEDCLCGLPGLCWRELRRCPVCDSQNVSGKKLSGPPWDPHWIYTPNRPGAGT